MLSHPTQFYIAITEVMTERGEFRQAQDYSDSLELIRTFRTSASAPVYSTNKEDLGGKLYNDGHIELAVPLNCFDVTKFDKVFFLINPKKRVL